MSTSTGPVYSNARRPPSNIPYPIAAGIQIWYGQAVCVSGSTGLLTPAADVSGLRYVGIAAASVNNTADGTGGALSAPVTPPTEIGQRYTQFYFVSPANTIIGQHVFFTDDHTVAASGSTSNTVCAGRVVSVDTTGTSGQVTVDTLDRFANATVG